MEDEIRDILANNKVFDKEQDLITKELLDLFGVSNNEVSLKAFLQKFVNDCEMGDAHEPLHLEEAKILL